MNICWQTLRKRPHFANMCVAATLGAAGDTGCQLLDGPQNYEPGRTARFAAYRFCVWGPLYSVFVTALDRLIGARSSAGPVAAKILADQLVWTPPSCSLFYMAMSAMEGNALEVGWRRVVGENFWDGALWRTLRLNWPVWGAVHVVTFAIVPLQFRVAFVSMMSVFWSGVLSGINQQARLAGCDTASCTTPAASSQ
mmetsp:Transcript_128642/g.274527  ORF Transcript_128642/g.274527 Transcript_128642/m.274527 type:complete len:196 (-) Transcript_128642:236-823(-)